jgi:hypothetical protein
MRNPISISNYGYLIWFGKKTNLNLEGTIWEKMILFYLNLKYDIKGLIGIRGYCNPIINKFQSMKNTKIIGNNSDKKHILSKKCWCKLKVVSFKNKPKLLKEIEKIVGKEPMFKVIPYAKKDKKKAKLMEQLMDYMYKEALKQLLLYGK